MCPWRVRNGEEANMHLSARMSPAISAPRLSSPPSRVIARLAPLPLPLARPSGSPQNETMPRIQDALATPRAATRFVVTRFIGLGEKPHQRGYDERVALRIP